MDENLSAEIAELLVNYLEDLEIQENGEWVRTEEGDRVRAVLEHL